MKILTLHCDYIRFKPVKAAIEKPEKAEKTRHEIKECLVVLSAVEKQDEAVKDAIVKELADNIQDIAQQVKAKTIVLYPYVHLTSEPASLNIALYVLKEAEKFLKKTKLKIVRAPFGWYKEFELKCKGHPLSELSRVIVAKPVSKAIETEKKLKSEWHVLTLDGKLHKIKLEKEKLTGFDFSKHQNLEKFAKYEMKKVRAVSEEPAHVRFMRKLELADYEPASDPGNFRFYPKGRLIKALLEDFVTKKMQDYGALEVETPIMYDYEHPALKNYLERFPARQYAIQSPNKKVFLRFAACFGQFILASQAAISYKDLPLKLYELTKYSFRVEQRGELVGLRRLRTFTMPDCHAICADLQQAKEEMKIRMLIASKLLKKIGLAVGDLEIGIRVTKDFLAKNKGFITILAKDFGKPALVEVWPERFFYFTLKYELNFVDALDKASALSTDQIDIESAQSYGIYYTDASNKKKLPIILHLSPSGSIERVIYALLEKAALDEKEKKPPSLPFWLCPTQARIVPISEKFIEQAQEMANDLNECEHIRTDIDDRNLHVEKKIFEAEQEWVPYVICLGKRELDKGIITVRIRQSGEIKEMKPIELKNLIKKEQAEMPWRPLPLPVLLSKRPRFV